MNVASLVAASSTGGKVNLSLNKTWLLYRRPSHSTAVFNRDLLLLQKSKVYSFLQPAATLLL